MQDFCKAEDVGDIEWTKVMMEMIVNKSIVDSEECCSCSWFRRLGKEAQVKAVYKN